MVEDHQVLDGVQVVLAYVSILKAGWLQRYAHGWHLSPGSSDPPSRARHTPDLHTIG
ncbi:hypothetical protein LX15_005048 [Streptoalloteichus tenebrarius]|uniref:Uncharacterized protein n=1 Tax=Streptoalloteichus tenebrarius (strain ATCC 17920 / DSM 40477 / JCM 4838 / CBS 697.72 / NBRC 16177 / NCIMB 11028 / NRRL B-12390 / A12253. 1 / ISP 5477) TaxID=1933 RepID=A0ABT1I0M0_STRSD|nr:hypothetical protein [Streptoalloteichus tenebrarius]BFF03726.1 hypothetical protein GCM10020241_54010 [Streptoalloteichus tenebrarius]